LQKAIITMRIMDAVLRGVVWLTGAFWLLIAVRLAPAFLRDGVSGVESELVHLGTVMLIDETLNGDGGHIVVMIYRPLWGWVWFSLFVIGADRWRAKPRKAGVALAAEEKQRREVR
jgi:hypothetical protein